MKFRFLFIFLSICTLTLFSCEKSIQGGEENVSPKVAESFNRMYPDAVNTVWSQRGDYSIASFSLPAGTKAAANANTHSAWFDSSNGEWGMTETEITYAQLPAAVKAAFEASEYAAWELDDDIDRLERVGIEPSYVLEVERGEKEFDLYYSEAGQLIKAVEDLDDDEDNDYYDEMPSGEFPQIESFIGRQYPGAKILEIEKERGMYEVEIFHEGYEKEVYLNKSMEWIRTETELRGLKEVPAAVMSTLKNKYPGMEIDDVTLVETPAETYYLVELEDRNDRDIEVKIASDGTVLK